MATTISIRNIPSFICRYRLFLRYGVCNQRLAQKRLYNAGCQRCIKSYMRSNIPIKGGLVRIKHRFLHASSVLNEETVVEVPRFAESVSEGDVRWEKAVGDTVEADEVICNIETDKTAVPVPAPFSGVLTVRFVEDGATVKPGQQLAKIVSSGDAGTSAKKKDTPPSPQPSATVTPNPPAASTPPPTTSASSASGGDFVLKVPAFADSVSEGDVRWEKEIGDSVAVDEVVCQIETDKTSVPVPSTSAGILEEKFAKDGETVKSGQQLGRIKIGAAGGVPSKAKISESTAPSQPPPPSTPSISTPTVSVPPVPRAAVPSTSPPPASQKKPVSIPVAAIKHAQSLDTATVKLPPQDPTKEITGTRSEQRVKMNRMRQRIAQRLKDAQNTAAMLTTFNELDMTNIMAFRKANLEAFQKRHGVKLSFMAPFLKASAYALQSQPTVNAVIDENEIVYRDYVDISVAVATPKGLVVPVVRNVESLTYAGIEKAIGELVDKARKGTLAVEDMDGGTFTVSNGGVFGSLMGTPIINLPQSAILGMHGVFERPVAVNGQVTIRPMMYIALTYDHRLIDGREAVLFLRKIKEGVENPAIIVAGL